MLTIVLENCQSFDIPKKYIRKRKILKGKPKSIWIDKTYLDICNEYLWFANENDTLKDAQQRLLNAFDITQIRIKDKTFFTHYIEDWYDRLGTDNILQSITLTDKVIKIEWDINPKNKIKGNYWYPYLILDKKYKKIKLRGYKKIIYK